MPARETTPAVAVSEERATAVWRARIDVAMQPELGVNPQWHPGGPGNINK